jgi:drug/metabolite transporter (DMT)-like permease
LLNTASASFFGFLLFLPNAIYDAKSFDFSSVGMVGWIPIIYYGIAVSVIVHILWFRGVSKVPASTAAIFTSVVPVSAAFLSYTLLKEPFLWSHLVGTLCVLLGIGMLTRGAPETRSIWASIASDIPVIGYGGNGTCVKERLGSV